MGINCKQKGNCEQILLENGIENVSVFSTSQKVISQYRSDWLGFLRMLYENLFFPDKNRYKNYPKDVLNRMQLEVCYTADQIERRDNQIISDFFITAKLLAQTLTFNLYQGYNKFVNIVNGFEINIPDFSRKFDIKNNYLNIYN